MHAQTTGKMHRISQLVHSAGLQLSATRVLMVGVGGIGCQILKVVCKMGIGAIHILDMDTIEITNLNRQFLFQKQHKGMSKSLVAKDVILSLNPSLAIEAHHKNIKELEISFFRQFQFIIMALDNIDARNYVNRIGVRLDIPIIDAGTMAYKGNVTTIMSGISRCYSCQPKSSSQKQFPVCTIRSRPEKPIHCIVWAKMLFQVMFGGNTDNDMNDLAVLTNKSEEEILSQLFQKDIENIKTSKEDLDKNKLTQAYLKRIRSIPSDMLSTCMQLNLLSTFNQFNKTQPVDKNIAIFVESCLRLKKQKERLGSVVFEKDDDDVIHFISSAANLRMHCFSIDLQSFDEVKNMAGNIVPAIASTNAIVSGIEIIELLKHLRGRKEIMKTYFIQNQHGKIFPLKLQKPLETCTICSPNAIPVTIECDFNKIALRNLISLIQQQSPTLVQFSINHGSKQIYNSEEPVEILLSKKMSELCQSYEFDLILTNEDTMEQVCTIWLIHNPQVSELSVMRQEKLIPQPKPEKMEAEEHANGNGVQPQDEESDIVIFGDEPSPEIEIIEVLKRDRTPEAQVLECETLKKKQKIDQ